MFVSPKSPCSQVPVRGNLNRRARPTIWNPRQLSWIKLQKWIQCLTLPTISKLLPFRSTTPTRITYSHRALLKLDLSLVEEASHRQWAHFLLLTRRRRQREQQIILYRTHLWPGHICQMRNLSSSSPHPKWVNHYTTPTNSKFLIINIPRITPKAKYSTHRTQAWILEWTQYKTQRRVQSRLHTVLHSISEVAWILTQQGRWHLNLRRQLILRIHVSNPHAYQFYI